MKYIDMPLQHINDAMLNTMKRRVTRKQIETLLNKLRNIPGMAIRTTFIAGSPGETDAQHKELVAIRQRFRLRHDGRLSLQPRTRHRHGANGRTKYPTK